MKYTSNYEKMTSKPIAPLLIELSIPTIINMMVTNIYNMADTSFVGRIGTSASGAVGVVFGFMSIIQAIGFMFGQGSGSIISRHLGAREKEKADVVVSTGFACAILFGTLIALLCFLFLDPLVYALGSTPTIAPYAKTYISYILIAAPGMVGAFLMNNVLRYEGKALLGMIGMCTGAVLNIAVDPILMFGLNMGIAGAGLSTCLSQYVSFFILLAMFRTGKTQSSLSLRNVQFDPSLILNIMGTGMPSLVRQGLNSGATILLNMTAGLYGDAAVAGMSIVTRIVFFVFSAALGIGQGFQPISGFSYGARRFKRLRKAFWTTMLLAESLMLILAVIVFTNAVPILRIFRDDPEVISVAERALKLQLISQLFLPPCMCIEMLLQSTGRKLSASFMSALRSGLLFIPALLILSALRGLPGIQEAQPVATVLSILPAILVGGFYLKKLPKEDGV